MSAVIIRNSYHYSTNGCRHEKIARSMTSKARSNVQNCLQFILLGDTPSYVTIWTWKTQYSQVIVDNLGLLRFKWVGAPTLFRGLHHFSAWSHKNHEKKQLTISFNKCFFTLYLSILRKYGQRNGETQVFLEVIHIDLTHIWLAGVQNLTTQDDPQG